MTGPVLLLLRPRPIKARLEFGDVQFYLSLPPPSRQNNLEDREVFAKGVQSSGDLSPPFEDRLKQFLSISDVAGSFPPKQLPTDDAGSLLLPTNFHRVPPLPVMT